MKRVCGALIALAGATIAQAQAVDPATGSIVEILDRLKPGQYVWAPNAAPRGPMLLIVNLRTQRATLYRNGVPIAASTVSTGSEGRETPTGIFTVLQKRVEHYSSKYDNAPMPYMQRLTWRGIALHAGNLPGYPASHGCIRLPAKFAQLLYGVTSLGMTVVIANEAAVPRIAPTPEMSGTARSAEAQPFEWNPERSPAGPVSIVISAADQKAFVIRNGVPIGTASVRVDGPITGTWAYALRSVDVAGQHWIRVPLSGRADGEQSVERSEWARFHAANEFKQAIAAIVEPGTTIVVTADSLRAGSTGTALTVIESAPK